MEKYQKVLPGIKRVQGIWGREKNGSIKAKSSKKKENTEERVYD